MSNHTPEPWRAVVDGNDIRARIVHGTAESDPDNPEWDMSPEVVGYKHLPTVADADRIVACVNACAGMELVDVARIPEMRKVLQQFIAEYDRGPEWVSADTYDQAVCVFTNAE